MKHIVVIVCANTKVEVGYKSVLSPVIKPNHSAVGKNRTNPHAEFVLLL